ncbi:hypothetical protein [Shewanella fodinae]|uniref:hypothetical protein n=1 Tax=Shewanella fodinae TaxID=552357 RepID=UPI00167B27DD|nr:hypothetical protein [Shewanella fodinae]MCL2905185.1 hypothetical protein [Shewanella fodinae]GGY87931.1 hypothetical protein GCM10007169_01390 [Shewanella fodinae]
MRTAEIKAALRSRFCAPEWAVFFEVGDGTGTNQRRWADAVAMNMWPSRGLEIHGFEIKVSRSDWTRELKNPEKSAKVQQYCDRWWIITPKGIVKPEELPPTWGLYEVSESGTIRQITAAPLLASVAVTRQFMAAMLRRAGGVDEDEISAKVVQQIEKIRAGDAKRIESAIQAAKSKYENLLEKVKTFEDVSGLSISKFGLAEETAKAVNLVVATGVLSTHGRLARLTREAESFAATCNEILSQFKEKEDA